MSCQFVVLSAPRTGSTMLQTRLCKLPGVVCYPALFSIKGWPRKGDLRHEKRVLQTVPSLDRWADPGSRFNAPECLLDDLLDVNKGYDAVGFKHHLTSTDWELTRRILDLKDLKRIVIERKNLLAAFSSQKLVEETGQGRADPGDQLRAATFIFDEDEFAKFCHRRVKSLGRWNSEVQNGRFLTLDYTEARTEAGIERVCQFLEVTYQIGAATTLQRHTSHIASRFVNSDHVLNHLERIGRLEWAAEP